MSRIALLEVSNFRGIENLSWAPNEGINCILGPGDTGKSTVLDAISLCLGSRNNSKFTEADFYGLNVDNEIRIDVTVAALPMELKRIESFGLFLRAFDSQENRVEDEPQKGLEPCLTMRLKVTSDLEPQWTLHSERAAEQGSERQLAWAQREAIAPIRIDDTGDFHLSWRKGSILRKLVDDPDELSAHLMGVMRDARNGFDAAGVNLESALARIHDTGREIGLVSAQGAKMLIDPNAASVSSGALALHGGDDVPLRALGQGSRRLLIAGLHKLAGAGAPALIVDEVEQGLEPHRIEQFLQTLGAGQATHDNQVFLTTHSPVTLRAVGLNDLFIARNEGGTLALRPLGDDRDAELAVRQAAEGFLSPKVLVCEGKTEAALIHALDDYRRATGERTLLTRGVCTVVGSGTESEAVARAFLNRGYETAWFLDADKTSTAIQQFQRDGGQLLTWATDEATEHALWGAMPDDLLADLLDLAINNRGVKPIEGYLKDHSHKYFPKPVSLADIQAMCGGPPDAETRHNIGTVANKNQWYKRNAWTLRCFARDRVFPRLGDCGTSLQNLVGHLDTWVVR